MRKKIKTISITSILLIAMLGITTTVSANGNGGDGGDPGGLTPGFWKNHQDDWVYFEIDDKLDFPFDFPNDFAIQSHHIQDSQNHPQHQQRLNTYPTAHYQSRQLLH